MYYKYAHPELFDGIQRTNFIEWNNNIIIYGAGFQGLLTAHLLKQRGVDILGFADNNPQKQNQTYFSFPIYSPEMVKQNFPNAAIIITPYNLEPAYRYMKDELKFKAVFTPYSLFLEFESSEFDTLQELPFWYHPDSLDLHIDMFLRMCVNLLTEHKLYAVDFCVTEKCSLRCKNCTSLIPCYQSPKHYVLEDILADAETLLNKRVFHHIYLEGGEVFLWEPLADFIETISCRENLLQIIPITNGTIIPEERLLKALKNPKVTVRISDYGAYTKRSELSNIFQSNGIKYKTTIQKWYELSVFQKEPKTGKELWETVNDCCKLKGKGTLHVLNGKLFHCPLQGHLHNLGIFKSRPIDYVDLREKNDVALQKRISAFFDDPQIAELCKHCNGRGYSGIEVPPAEQLMPWEKMHIRFE